MIQGKTYIIAEAGVNHNGSLKLAKELVDAAVDAGVDAVKFQTFRAESLTTRQAPKANYQIQGAGAQSQYEMLKELELDVQDHTEIISHCRMRSIEFLSTPFDIDSVNLLTEHFNLPRLKVPSGEITNAPLLLAIARTQKPVILSSGMSSLGEVEAALAVLAFGYTNAMVKPSTELMQAAFFSVEGQAALQNKVVLLHCTTEYPAPFEDVNLRAMDTLRQASGLPVGLSDHTNGIAVSIAAVARGAVLIEKHFTLDKNLPGPDHKASLEPNELKALVSSIRQVEKALGNGIKIPGVSELQNKDIARKSLVAATNIECGDVFSQDNITTKRPGNGISPMYYWCFLGRQATRKYEKDDLLV